MADQPNKVAAEEKAKAENAAAGSENKGSVEKAGTKGGDKKKDGKGKGKKKGKKKKVPRCPIQRRKKAIKAKCIDDLEATAVLNSYYVCHSVPEMLKFRKFIWKKKKK